MEWSRATEETARMAARWTAEGGPGGAIVLFNGMNIHSEASGGLASLELNLPFTAETVVRYASISKHFCTALLLRLQAEGVLSLADTLGTHLPMLSRAQGAVPIARALDMTGGLPDAMETLWQLGVPLTAAMSRDALFEFIAAVDAVNFPVGSEISYSNTGYRLVEAALALKSISYGDALREHFFRPLGLSMRLPEDESEPVPNLAAGYWRSGNEWRRGRYGLHFSAAGGLAGSARDLAAWLMALMTGRAPAADLLAPLGARRRLIDGTQTGYGLGLARSPVQGEIAVGHGGSLPGYKNHFLLLPERQAGIVVVSNREDVDAHGIALQVMAVLTGCRLPQPAHGLLPQGLFVAESGPFWIEHAAGELTVLGGAAERLYLDENGGAVTRSAHLPVRLRGEPWGIAGEIGHVARTFGPVATDIEFAKGWDGDWICERHGARCGIERTDGGMQLTMGTGPLRVTMQLTPLDPHRALSDRRDGPWRQRACLVLNPRARTLRMATNRSRVLQFRKV
jgi:CubicO group peptidase (beta-lactamase class C family)